MSSPVSVIRREIDRVLGGIRRPFRGRLARFSHRQQGAMLVQGEGLPKENLRDMELFQHGGFVSGLPGGTEYIVLPLDGRTERSVVIATEYGQYRVQVGVGEVALYHLTEPDCWVHLKAGRVIAARCRALDIQADESISLTAPTVTVQASTGASFNTPLLTASADVRAGGDVTVRAATSPYSMNAWLASYHQHTHGENNITGGQTEPPAAGFHL